MRLISHSFILSTVLYPNYSWPPYQSRALEPICSKCRTYIHWSPFECLGEAPAPGVCPSRAPALEPFFAVLLHRTRVLAQENLPPSFETKIAAGVQALKSGDLNSAEQVFTDACGRESSILSSTQLGVIGNCAASIPKRHRFRQALALQPNYGPSRLLSFQPPGAPKKCRGRARTQARRRLLPEEPQAHLQLAKAYKVSDNWIAAVRNTRSLCSWLHKNRNIRTNWAPPGRSSLAGPMANSPHQSRFRTRASGSRARIRHPGKV